MENERNWKQRIKDAWNKNKGKIKLVIGSGTVIYLLGKIAGMKYESEILGDAVTSLTEKLPNIPDLDDYPIETVLQGSSKADIIELMDVMIRNGEMTE